MRDDRSKSSELSTSSGTAVGDSGVLHGHTSPHRSHARRRCGSSVRRSRTVSRSPGRRVRDEPWSIQCAARVLGGRATRSPRSNYAQRVRVRAVVLEQRVVVGIDEKLSRSPENSDAFSPAAGSGGAIQRSRAQFAAIRPAAARRSWLASPSRYRFARQPSSAISASASLESLTSRPQLSSGGPAVALQVVGDRREDVAGVRPDVAPAVAVEVLRALRDSSTA